MSDPSSFTARPRRRRRWPAVAAVAGVLAAGVPAAVTVARPGSASPGPAPAVAPVASATPQPSPRRTFAAVARPAPVATGQAVRFVRAELRPGAEGPDVVALQDRLRSLRFDPGPSDGYYGLETLYAVWAFEKLHGAEPDGVVDRPLWRRMLQARPPQPLAPDAGPDRVEVDLDRQVLVLYEAGEVALVTHVSTGSGERFCTGGRCRYAVTPPGDFSFTWRWTGWRTSELGELYNPVYFNGGIAVHGAYSVPTHPASHGCVRVPMHIAEYLPDLVARGDPVVVR